MPNIQLDENHNYTVSGIKRPGVSEIISNFGFNDFSMIPEHILTPAVNFGNVVHRVIYLTEMADTKGFNDDHKKIQKHWEDFKKTIKLENCVIDIKSNASGKPSIGNILQIFAYKILIENQKIHTLLSIIETMLFSETWNFCGKPDYFVCKSGKIKKLHIVCINLDGFKPTTFDAVKDNKYEQWFKSMVQIYQLQKKERIT